MSAERLREAAALMRKSWGEAAERAAELAADGQNVGTIAPTLMAVADWLDRAADLCVPIYVANARVTCGPTPQNASGPQSFTYSDFDIGVVEGDPHALAVATAYLGEQP